MLQQIKVYSRLWQRIGLLEIWDRTTLFLAIGIVAILSFAFDVVRLDNYSLGWIPVNAISLGIAIVIVVFGLRIAKSQNLALNERVFFNLTIASIAMGTKNVVTLMLCEFFGIQDSGSLPYRFFGGALIGVSFLILFSNLRGAKIERIAIQNRLLAKERALIDFRENITDIFANEQKALTDRTAVELLPRLLLLQEKVSLGKSGASITKELEQFLRNDVRPLSNSLAKEAASLQLAIPSNVELKPVDLKVRINLARTIRPFSTGLLVGISWTMLAQFAIPQATILDISVATVIYQLLLLLIKFSVRRFTNASVNQALIFAAIPGTIAATPSYYLLYQIPNDLGRQTLLPTFLVVGALASLLFILADVVDRGRAVAEERLAQVVNQFSRENKLFEQKLWVAQHVWYTLLHGTVQSALTTAAIRAGGKNQLTASDQEAIVQDLNRAIVALRNPQAKDVIFENSLLELQQTWSGICSVETKVDPELLTALAGLADARIITNEVVKEAVSNAVKHGGATQATINLSLSADREILVNVSNNGAAPRPGAGAGIGTSIFDAVCLNYELTRDTSSELTQFQARIPLA